MFYKLKDFFKKCASKVDIGRVVGLICIIYINELSPQGCKMPIESSRHCNESLVRAYYEQRIYQANI